MPLGRDQAVAPKRRVAGQESDRVGVFVDVVMTVVRVTVQERADEARPFAGPARILFDVERPPSTSAIFHWCIMPGRGSGALCQASNDARLQAITSSQRTGILDRRSDRRHKMALQWR